MKRCIIVQGPTYSNSISQIRECWKGYDVIYSTWAGTEGLYEGLYTNDERVIYSPLPSTPGTYNMNYQKMSTIAGLELAKSMGYDRALKMRSDMWVKNPQGFFDKLTDGYNTLFWYQPGAYLSDYWMEDTIDNLLTLWDVVPEGTLPPERILTDRLIELGWLARVNLLVSELSADDVDIFWNRRNIAYWMHRLNTETEYKNNI
jgi:hypothetical protein